MNEPTLYSRLDADRILRRAAEIEGTEDARAISVEELRAIAGEAGFNLGTVERAIADIREANQAAAGAPPVQKWGLLFTHLSTLREVSVSMNADQLTRVVRLFHPYREGPAQVKLEENEITWLDRKGIRFSLSSAGGVTEIRVHLSKLLLRKGRWMGWVKSAADRLESLTLLVARQGGRGTTEARTLPPETGTAAR